MKISLKHEELKTRKLFQRVIKQALSRPEELTVSQWAEKYRILTEASSMPGRWLNSVTPYLIGIMDAFNNPYIQHINFCKPTQTGGTEALINMLSYIVMQSPAPTMVVYPTKALAKDVSNDKLRPAFKKVPEIKDKFYENDSSQFRLRFRGMNMYLRGAGSPSELASKEIKYLLFDEIDKFGGASKKEASPYNLALERTKTYSKSGRKIYTCSTPTLKTNYIWSLHEAADEQKHFFVPCPHCGEFIELVFGQIAFNKDDTKELSITERANTAFYVCQECYCNIADKDKAKMLKRGEWRTTRKNGDGIATSVSFRLNSLYSIFVNWKDVVKEFLESKEEPDKFQNFVNSWLAEPWEDTKLKTSPELVHERETKYNMFEVPDYTRMLTAGVDVQQDCVYWTIRAWGEFITSQNIAHGQALSLQEIEDIMNREYPKEDGTTMLVDLCLIDSGDQTDIIYDFCINNSDWAIPVKGSSKRLDASYRISIINKSGSKASGTRLIIVDGDKYKDIIASRMRRDNGRGSWMVYKDCDDNYAKQVTAEHKISVKASNGVSVLKWVPKQSHIDNHYLDAEVYALAAADILGIRGIHLSNSEEKKKQAVETEQRDWIKQEENWIK